MVLVYIANPVIRTFRNDIDKLKTWIICSKSLLKIGSGSFPFLSGARFVNALLFSVSIVLTGQIEIYSIHISGCIL